MKVSKQLVLWRVWAAYYERFYIDTEKGELLF